MGWCNDSDQRGSQREEQRNSDDLNSRQPLRQHEDQPQRDRETSEREGRQLQRGVHTSTRQLEADIRAFIEKHNEDPKPFRWTKSADDILAAVKRFCLRVDQNLCHKL